jgi:hypothetical protein
VIVDLFQGQLQCRIVCPTCQKRSSTFDPFMYLSVPIPIQNERGFKVHHHRHQWHHTRAQCKPVVDMARRHLMMMMMVYLTMMR